MKIKIDQTLHGYGHGHQLLSSSTNLSIEVKEILLIQSDLSGSSIDNGFKEYITGYPLSNNKFAFAKTWYADEMKRPGCVWTHTLLIDFSDLGKIPDFDKLLLYFRRPTINDYVIYQLILELDVKELLSREIISQDSITSTIMSTLYEEFHSGVMVPADSSFMYEKIILQIWSNQWPRLRRNFTFCSGSLNNRFLNGKEFDLQIIPKKNAESVLRKSTVKIFTGDYFVRNNVWIETIYSARKNELRHFLWVYGSDIPGTREYFIPLILMYSELSKKNKSLKKVTGILAEYFNEPNEAKHLKNNIFDANNIFGFKEKEVVKYLLLTKFSPVLNIEVLNIERRIVDLFRNKEIYIEEFLEMLLIAKPNRIQKNIWNYLNLEEDDILYLLSKDDSMFDIFKEKIALLAEEKRFWEENFDFQLKIYHFLKNISCDWRAIIFSILDTGSAIITTVVNKEEHINVQFVFEWQQSKNIVLNSEIGTYIFRNFKNDFFSFVRANSKTLSSANCYELFNYFNSNEIISVNLNSVSWIYIYSKVLDKRSKVFASCVLLAMAFNKKISNPELLIPECFEDVFNFAKDSLVKEDLWKIIPVDTSEEDESDINPFSFFFGLFNFSSKIVAKVQDWDYCEILIRTLTNKFIKNSWPIELYVETLKNHEILSRCIQYCMSFKKGSTFLDRIFNNISNGKIEISNNQTMQIMNFIKK